MSVDEAAGKTWLAKRAARRCAEDALEALVAGGTLDEVELPLYTTCSRLFSAGGDIRMAAVSSALDQLGDLGGSRLPGKARPPPGAGVDPVWDPPPGQVAERVSSIAPARSSTISSPLTGIMWPEGCR